MSELVLACRDPEVLARFWGEVLDFTVLDRLLAAGAELADIGQTGQESWHVLADPEGNEFCLLKARLAAQRTVRHQALIQSTALR
ncbi:VOC family protein [Streptomyces sp. NPDC059866]|uniref:VOC family protein n=1 Tax=Streptomyces sp. NPDC059866 TaxID=3346978 RepID=UPI003648CFB3